MAYEVFLPKLGANMTEGKIEQWHVAEGDSVKVGDPLFELVTDKATIDVEAERRGVMKKILAKAGDTVPISGTVAIIGEENENVEAILENMEKRNRENKESDDKAEKKRRAKKIPMMAKPGPATLEIELMMAPRTRLMPGSHNVKASPRAKRRAKQAGIDLNEVSYDGEIITMEDVEMHILSAGRPKSLVIIGAGQYSKVVREILETRDKIEIIGYIDDNPDLHNVKIREVPVLGGVYKLKEAKSDGVTHFIVTVGESRKRAELFEKAVEAGLKPFSAIHPQACISKSAKIADGCVVEAFSVIAVDCKLGKGVFVTQNCSVSHDCVIGEYSHLAPGCHLGGTVTVGKGVLIGVGCSISPNVHIGDNTIIAPGSSVDRPAPENRVIEGVPGRVIGKRTVKARI